MTTEEIGPNIKISLAETKKSAARHEKVLRKFRTTFPWQSTGTMLQVPRGPLRYSTVASHITDQLFWLQLHQN